MSSTTPVWRTAKTLSKMFWCGIALAPLAALLLLVGNSGTMIKLALIVGLASVVLIGLSVTWRKDAGKVEKSLTTALSDVESDTHQMISELRHQVRAIERGAPAAPAGPPEHELGRGRGRPHPEMSQHNGYAVQAGRGGPQGDYDYPREQQRRAEAAYESTGGMDQQRRGDYESGGIERQHRQPTGGIGQQQRRGGPQGDYDYPREQQRRSEAAYESTGEMDQQRRQPSYEESEYRRTETVSVTHRRSQEEAARAMGERHSRGRREDPRAEADSILSGLQGESSSQEDWRGGETVMVPQQHTGGHHRYDDQRGRYGQGHDWHAEERSAEMRMGMRQSRGGRGEAPEDGWSQDPSGRHGRHYGGGDGVEPTRAISAYEAEPQPRWGDYNQKARGGSYMDQYYGENSRR